VFTEVFIDSPGVGKVRLGAANGTFCKITRKYIGPFLHDLEKAAQILPGICPIPKVNPNIFKVVKSGRYSGLRILLDSSENS
jgi:hypothetical protein